MEAFDLSLSWSKDTPSPPPSRGARSPRTTPIMTRSKTKLTPINLHARGVVGEDEGMEISSKPLNAATSELGFLARAIMLGVEVCNFFINFGATDKEGNYYKHTVLQNKISLFFLVNLLSFLPVTIYEGIFHNMVSNMIIMCLHSCAMTLNLYEYRGVSRVIFVATFFNALLWNTWILGREAGLEIFIFPVLVLWILITPVDGLLGRYAPLRLGLPTMVCIAYWGLILFTDDPLNIHENVSKDHLKMVNDQMTYPLMVAISFATVIIVVWWVKEANARSERMLGEEHDALETLLNDLLPQSIVNRLKSGERDITESQPQAAIMFFDIVGFTSISSRLQAVGLVSGLSKVFHTLDSIVEQHERVEKIKTIGDAYMVGAGVLSSEPSSEDVVDIVRLALKIRDASIYLEFRNERNVIEKIPLSFRFGIHVGEVLSGVIPQKRLLFDVFGETVSIAAKLESESEPDMITCSHSCMKVVAPLFKVRNRGLREIKGRGKMRVYEIVEAK